MTSLLLLVLGLFSAIHLTLALTGQEIATYFRQELTPESEVFLPTDSNYTQETTQRWTTYKAPTYIVAVKPASELDVQTIVRLIDKPTQTLDPPQPRHCSPDRFGTHTLSFQVQYASANDIPFLGTGGGHGYTTTLGSLRNGISIDLGLFRDVSIDATGNTMTIGGSVRFGDIFGPLYAAGKEIRR